MSKSEVDLTKLTEEEAENVREFLSVIIEVIESSQNNKSLENDDKSESTDSKQHE